MPARVIFAGWSALPALRSWPEEKCLPLACSTMTFTSGSSAAMRHASSRSSSSGMFCALAASGRFSVMVAIASATSYWMKSVCTGAPGFGGKGSDAENVGEVGAVMTRVPEEQFIALRAPEVQVGRVLPGVADAAVHLDVGGSGGRIGVGAPGLGDRRQHVLLRPVGRDLEGGTPGGRLARLDREEHVGADVLDGLERADRPAELRSDAGVAECTVQRGFRATYLTEREADRGEYGDAGGQ